MSYLFTGVSGLLLAVFLQFATAEKTDPERVSVGLCQVVAAPATYNEKAVSVEGILSPGEHSLALYNPTCRPKEGFNVSIQAVLPPAWESTQNGKHLQKFLRGHKEAQVALRGTFESGGGPYGPDAARFRFSISEISSVAEVGKVVGARRRIASSPD